MDLYNSYPPINSKEFISHEYIPFLYSNPEKRINNSFFSSYYESTSKDYREKKEFISNKYVKKSINLDISPSIDNSFKEQKKENISFMRRYSSLTNLDKNKNLPYDKNKKTLILDLDETLVHSAFTPFERKSDLILNINIEGVNRTLYVLKRPHVDKFLYELSSIYEIIIFTASISQYANPLLDELDKNKYIKYRFFREHCTFTDGIYIKDLKIFDRKLNNMIIIDNNPLSYDNNIDNGIPILSWYDNINDNELLKLLPLLKYMSKSSVQDVRSIINQIVDRNKNEIDFIAINRILSIEQEKNKNKSNLTIENKYPKNYNSQEPKRKISKKINSSKVENNCKIYNKSSFTNPLKNNYINFIEENRKILNKKLNFNYGQNMYNNYSKEKDDNNLNQNLFIDKKDPYGTRVSIFSPEEYNISNSKYFNLSYNSNKNNKVKIEEEKNDSMQNKYYNNYLTNNYKKNYSNNDVKDKRENEQRSFTPNINNKIKNNLLLNNEDYSSPRKISKKYSLVELTKKALHLIDEESSKEREKKEHEYGTISNTKKYKSLFKYNNYLNKDNDIIYNNYTDSHKYLSNHKTANDINKESMNNLYFNKYIEESKDNNDKIPKKIKSFNDRFLYTNKYLYNNKFQTNKEIDKKNLLNRINNDKINSFLNANKTNINLYRTENGFYNFNSKNYLQNKNKDNNFKMLKNSLIQNKKKLYNNKKDIFNNKYLNYLKSEKIEKKYNTRYDFTNNKENKNALNNMIRYNSFSYNNDKKPLLNNLKKSISKNNEEYNIHKILRSSSYAFPSSLNSDNFSLNDSFNKGNYNNNMKYRTNLNYKYEIINSQNKQDFVKDKYSNTYNGTNDFKYKY